MASVRISHRLGRMGKINPGHQHLAGADVTAKMQRQYEDILASLRDVDRYRSDRKRKQVAAATVRKLAQNPSGRELAERLAEEFHGRKARGEFEVTETETYDEFAGVLGYLARLGILDPAGTHQIPISFEYDPETPRDNILLVATDEHNMEFVGGDQYFDWQDVEGASTSELKNLVFVGPVYQIDYWADKHHLTGPKQQQDGMIYYHIFGETGGELPWLIFDTRNTKLILVGGDYTIEPEGITG